MTLAGFARLADWLVIRFLLQGLWVTLQISFWSILISFACGTLIGIARFSGGRRAQQLAGLYVETIRNLPMLLIILAARFWSGLPPMWAGVAGISIFVTAIIAEIVRGGLKAVDRGQWEAAYSQGFSYVQVMRHVALPQALRKMIPPIVSQFITVIKDTSFVWMIGVEELTGRGVIIFSKYLNPFEVFFVVAVVYFVINYSVSVFARRLEKRLAAASY